MQSVDMNLLAVLDALLQEGSVSGAARRLHLTPPAVSRSLGRLRAITGDPLLVRAGRNLVPTPIADSLRERTHEVVAAVHEILGPLQAPSDDELERTLHRVFTVRTGPDNANAFGPALFEEMRSRAPQSGLHLVGDDAGAAEALRDGQIDLVLGSPIAGNANGLHREVLLTDTVVIVARRDGALARTCKAAGPTAAQLTRYPHVNRVPESVWHEAADLQLAERGLARTVAATAPGFAAAFALVRSADLICLAPERLTRRSLGADLRSWPSPIPLPELVIEQCWHHRSHSDPEHRWLRDRVRAAVSAVSD
ncbi:LysR family transcriptional regulator [Mycobacterium sp.]|uniref:LysR family transcriptional regulator n=1 Tax=Mycobacterium sp. TaxID=1785 RepID=UPI002600EBF7|nr:LysR family transcriptional regulator [Mycobacterium sp.]